MEEKLKDDLLGEITRDSETLDVRNFILLKTIHTCELNYPDSIFWPVEIAITSFNLKIGYTTGWWTLVDTGAPSPLSSVILHFSKLEN